MAGYALTVPRIVIRSIMMLCLVLAFGLFIADGAACVQNVNLYNSEFGEEGADYSSSFCWTDPMLGDIRPIIIVVVAVLWSAVEFITFCVNRKGIHPIANLTLDILISLALISVAAIGFYNYATVGPVSYAKYLAATIFTLFAALLLVALFILDSIAVHKLYNALYAPQTDNKVMYMPYPQGLQPVAQPMVYQQQVGAYSSLPPPPPGMMYLVPVQQGAVQSPGAVPVVPPNIDPASPEQGIEVARDPIV